MKYYNQIQDIKMSLGNKVTSIDLSTNKAEYDTVISSTFKYNPSTFNFLIKDTSDIFNFIIDQMYKELIATVSSSTKYTHIILFVTLNNKIYDNALEINTLENIKCYGAKDIWPLTEFYKMTINIKN
jgi:hypothetical protein